MGWWRSRRPGRPRPLRAGVMAGAGLVLRPLALAATRSCGSEANKMPRILRLDPRPRDLACGPATPGRLRVTSGPILRTAGPPAHTHRPQRRCHQASHDDPPVPDAQPYGEPFAPGATVKAP